MDGNSGGSRTQQGLFVLCLAFFFLAGLLFLPIPGLHYDEILFLHPFVNDGTKFDYEVAGHKIPIMSMAYVGSLKSWLYWPLYTWLAPSEWVVRLPMLLLAIGSICLLYAVGKRLWGGAAAVLAVAAACTNPTFLLAQVFDWGPVALQIFLMLLAGWLVLRFTETSRALLLFLAALATGLTFWNKATYVWTLAGFGVATIVCWPRVLLRWKPRFILTALGGFLIGASPFLFYNFSTSGETYRESVRLETKFPSNKLQTARTSVDGSGVATNVGFFSVWSGECVLGQGQPGMPALPESYRWFPERTWQYGFFLAAVAVVCGVALVRPRKADRPALWMVIALVVSVASAVATAEAGTGIHHYAPLLPLVFLLMAAAFHQVANVVGLSSRAGVLLIALVAAMPLQSAVSLAGWYLRAETCGGRPTWTDAIDVAATETHKRGDLTFYVFDWGLDPQLKYLTEKRAKIRYWEIPAEVPAPGSPQEEESLRIMHDPKARVLRYVAAEAPIPQRQKSFESLLARNRREAIVTETVFDERGRAIYEILILREAKIGSAVEPTDGTPAP